MVNFIKPSTVIHSKVKCKARANRMAHSLSQLLRLRLKVYLDVGVCAEGWTGASRRQDVWGGVAPQTPFARSPSVPFICDSSFVLIFALFVRPLIMSLSQSLVVLSHPYSLYLQLSALQLAET